MLADTVPARRDIAQGASDSICVTARRGRCACHGVEMRRQLLVGQMPGDLVPVGHWVLAILLGSVGGGADRFVLSGFDEPGPRQVPGDVPSRSVSATRRGRFSPGSLCPGSLCPGRPAPERSDSEGSASGLSVSHVAAIADRARAMRERTVPRATPRISRDLVVGEITDVPEDDCGAELHWQRGESGVDVDTGRDEVGRIGRRSGLRRAVRGRIGSRRRPAPSAPGLLLRPAPGASRGDPVARPRATSATIPVIGRRRASSHLVDTGVRGDPVEPRAERASPVEPTEGVGWRRQARPGWRRARPLRCRASAGTAREQRS